MIWDDRALKVMTKLLSLMASSQAAFASLVIFCSPACMIQCFRDKNTKVLYHGQRVCRCVAVPAQAERRLPSLDSVTSQVDLAGLPSNNLEALHGDRQGQHSIRINDQWRVLCGAGGWPTQRGDCRLSLR